MLRPHQEPSCFIGEQVLGQQLFNRVQQGSLYDEVGDIKSYGWFGLLMMDKIPYIVSYKEDSFQYKSYLSTIAARKAWDHICAKFEKWYIKNEESLNSIQCK